MDYVPTLAFAGSAACAGLMGFAIQRGATCSVAAVEEWMTRRRYTRLVGMLEASLWVVAGLLICFAGGLLMGAGSLLIPGSNDGLILIGMPLLRPYAWIAFATMCVVIGASIRVGRLRSGVAANRAGAAQILRAGE